MRLKDVTDLLEKEFGERPHVEKCRGSADQNITYCSKDGRTLEAGEPKEQGKRKDLEELKDALETGETTLNDIILDDPIAYHQYGRTLEKIEDIVKQKKGSGIEHGMPECKWYWGKTGVGKSHRAYSEASKLGRIYVYRAGS